MLGRLSLLSELGRTAVARLRVGAPFPNPASRAGMALALHASEPTRVVADIVDAAGRRVRSLPERTISAGAYFVRVTAGAEGTVRKVVVGR